MNWNRKIVEWFIESVLGSFFLDLIFNWWGTATKLAALAPFIDLLIPHIGIGGIFAILLFNCKLFNSMRPVEKFKGEYHRLHGLRESLPTDKSAFSSKVDMGDDETMHYIRDICLKYKIPCLEILDVGSPRTKLLRWRYFANDLVRCSLNKNLKEARSLVNPQSEDE